MDDIFWHDCMIKRVIETPSRAELVMEVDYPTNWEENEFEPRQLVFTRPLDYHVDEGPFLGNPTILAATIRDLDDGGHAIVLETNAGKRSLRFSTLELRSY